MDTPTLLWTLVATVFAGLVVFVQKVIAEEGRNSAFNGLMMYGGSGITAVIIFVLSFGTLPAHLLPIAFFGLAAGAVHGVANFLRIESLKYIDGVIFFPLNKMLGPLLVVMGGIAVFHDSLTVLQYIGIGLGLTVPLLLLSAAEQRRQKNLWFGLQLLFFSTIFSAGSLLLGKQGLLSGQVILMLCMSQTAGTIASAAILIHKHGAGWSMITHADKRDVLLGVLAAFCTFFSAFGLYQALSTGLVSIVYAIQAHYILIPIVLSVWWYREHINFRKLAAVIISFAAIAFLAI